MKKISLTLFALSIAFLSAIGQTNAAAIVTKTDGKVIISEVIQTPNISAKDLYSNTLLWISQTFNSSKSVIQTQNQETGLLTLRAHISVSENSWTDFAMTIQVKDGRYKYSITDIVFRYSQKFQDYGAYDNKIEENEVFNTASDWKEKILKEFFPLILSLKKGITIKSDW